MPTRAQASLPRDREGALNAVLSALRVVWCCAGPLIVAGIGLSLTGAALHSAWLVTVGGVIVLMGTGHALRCHRLRRLGLAGPDDCCSAVDMPTGRNVD
ncbi:hypothetical protein [Streptomyces dysideae]|uniref:Uncharacterized protein n=1 Tax=Streptomyces dysideae TaxID=909626 RepID=A0A101UPC7_9ACTN|nr:hypothetical protein [Streptomyces dysideae]KUO14428.1 hypothetical protein AQJ91_46885 [Streptomyces dysideae]